MLEKNDTTELPWVGLNYVQYGYQGIILFIISWVGAIAGYTFGNLVQVYGKPMLASPLPYLGGYPWGFILGYLISNRMLRIREWMRTVKEEPVSNRKNNLRFFAFAALVGYIIAIIHTYPTMVIEGTYRKFTDLVFTSFLVWGSSLTAVLGGMGIRAYVESRGAIRYWRKKEENCSTDKKKMISHRNT